MEKTIREETRAEGVGWMRERDEVESVHIISHPAFQIMDMPPMPEKCSPNTRLKVGRSKPTGVFC